MSVAVRPMSMKQAVFAWDILRYSKVVVAELDGSKIKIEPADTQSGLDELATWKGPKWSPGSPDHQRKLGEFEVAACRARILAERGVGHHEIQPLLDYWGRVSNRSDMTPRRKAEGVIERLNAIGITGSYVGGDDPPKNPRRVTMVAAVPPVVQAAPAPVQPPAPAPQPAPQGLSPLEVFTRINELKAAGLNDDQIKLVLGLLK